MWVGSSEKNLNAIFEKARSQKPCVLFFDEVDALMKDRGDSSDHGELKRAVNAVLQEKTKRANPGGPMPAAKTALRL